MANKIYIARNYRSKFDAAGKAKMDCETILENSGWRNLGFKQTWISNGLVGTLISAIGVTWALLRLRSKTVLFLQYPFNKFYRYCVWGAGLKKCTIITLVHDVASLKKRHKDPRNELTLLAKSNTIIVHTKAMQTWFEEQNVTSNIVQIEAFDYLYDNANNGEKQPIDHNKLRVVFAGNMGAPKSFLYDFDLLKPSVFCVDLYGIGFMPQSVKNPHNTILNYKGVFPADQVIDRIDGDFGLVWYGNSMDSCDGETGQYMKYNSPHKLSLYVLCGMPIIIWNKAAMADFVESNQIGFTVNSLKELPEKLNSLKPEDITRFKRNLMEIREKMQRGGFLLEATEKAMMNLT